MRLGKRVCMAGWEKVAKGRELLQLLPNWGEGCGGGSFALRLTPRGGGGRGELGLFTDLSSRLGVGWGGGEPCPGTEAHLEPPRTSG